MEPARNAQLLALCKAHGFCFRLNTTQPKFAGMSADSQRLWLNYPTSLVTRPVIWELAKKFDVVFNIRQASVTDEVGLVSLELQGERSEIKRAIEWLESLGIKVEPVEINTIEG
jgi:L-aspartate semialdehyde sulfurtransferase ferredoxin